MLAEDKGFHLTTLIHTKNKKRNRQIFFKRPLKTTSRTAIPVGLQYIEK